MTTEKDIDESIRQDVERFNHATYDGFLPENLFPMFKVALMNVPLSVHQINPDYLKKLLVKRQNELNFIEVGMVINLLKMPDPIKIYSSLDEFVDTSIEFNKVSSEYNKKAADFEKACIKKKAFRMKVSGLNNGSVKLNEGLTIVEK